MYRKEKTPGDNLFLQELEEYGNWIYHRQNIWEEEKIGEFYYLIPAYLKWREELFKSYGPLFGSSAVDEISDERLEALDARDRTEMMSAIEKENKTKKWAWESFLLEIAGGDRLKVKDVLKENLILQLNLKARSHELGE